MIDFTNCENEYRKYYDGLNGKKKAIYYENELYMLKFPKENHINDDNYASSTINEHISSNIFKILGFNTQDTLLGTYDSKIVVACKDFEYFENQLFSFGKIKNSVLDGSDSSSFYDTDLNETLNAIENQRAINPNRLKEHFWKMFIADTLIANFDRHNGNWGFLTYKNGNIDIAPIFACGSSLYPKLNIDDIKHYLGHEGSFNDLMLNHTTSAISINGKKINPQNFLKENTDRDIMNALQSVLSQIDRQKINALIDSLEIISDTRKEFYKFVIEKRECFLKNVFKKNAILIPSKDSSIDEKITQIDNAKSQLKSEPHISSHDKAKQIDEQIDDDKNSEADSYKPRKP